MSNITSEAISSLQNAIAGSSSQIAADAFVSAVVTEAGRNGVWVRFDGADGVTPIESTTSSVKPGDAVSVRVSNGRAYITGNTTAPATDDTVAYRADSTAKEASKDAKNAAEAAESAINDAATAKEAADVASASANQAVADAATAGRAASVAQAAAEAAQAAADGAQADIDEQREWFWHDANGAHVLGDESGYRNDITSTGMAIVDTSSEETVAEFGQTTRLGKLESCAEITDQSFAIIREGAKAFEVKGVYSSEEAKRDGVYFDEWEPDGTSAYIYHLKDGERISEGQTFVWDLSGTGKASVLFSTCGGNVQGPTGYLRWEVGTPTVYAGYPPDSIGLLEESGWTSDAYALGEMRVYGSAKVRDMLEVDGAATFSGSIIAGSDSGWKTDQHGNIQEKATAANGAYFCFKDKSGNANHRFYYESGNYWLTGGINTSGNLAMKAGNSTATLMTDGRMGLPSGGFFRQPSCLFIGSGGDIALATSTKKVTFGTAGYNDDTVLFTPNSGGIKVNKSGHYLVIAQVACGSLTTGDQFNVYIYRDSTNMQRAFMRAGAQQCLTIVRDCWADAGATFYAYAANGTAARGVAYGSPFSFISVIPIR